MTTEQLIADYYAAFNRGDAAGMLALLDHDVRHDVNQGASRHGKAAFSEFLAHMDRCYSEKLTDLVVMTDRTGAHAAATFTVHGVYKAADEGLPPASGQTYVLPAGAFFDLHGGLITRVATTYNLNDWLRQVGA